MRLYDEKVFTLGGHSFKIRKVGRPRQGYSKGVGHYVLFQAGRFKCRGTFKLCKAWAEYFALQG